MFEIVAFALGYAAGSSTTGRKLVSDAILWIKGLFSR